MRGNDEQQGTVFSSINPEERIPADRPLRSIGAMVDGSREELWAHFEALYARRGRRSIPPEKRLWAVLLQLLDSIRRERPLFQEEKFIAELRRRKVAPHGAEREPNPHWRTEEERHDPDFASTQKKRRLIEKVFGWGKLDSILRQVKLRGARKVDWFFRFLATAANLVRMGNLIPAV